MDEREYLYVEEDEIADYLFYNLIRRGFALKEEDINTLTEILFDFLVDKCIIEEEPK